MLDERDEDPRDVREEHERVEADEASMRSDNQYPDPPWSVRFNPPNPCSFGCGCCWFLNSVGTMCRVLCRLHDELERDYSEDCAYIDQERAHAEAVANYRSREHACVWCGHVSDDDLCPRCERAYEVETA